MKYAADFRSIARKALTGKWGIAVIAYVIATLLGGIDADALRLKLNVDITNADVALLYGDQIILSTNDGFYPEWEMIVAGMATYIAVLVIVLAILYFVLGRIVELGYSRFQLELVDENEAKVESLFQYFPHWKTAAIAGVLQSVYVFLWSLLFLIPGIVASYSYAMTSYILADCPEITASEAITKSKEMMSGNRFRLFCLHFSFIGWDLLCMFTFGIGNLWLIPYKQAATAAFYREISGR